MSHTYLYGMEKAELDAEDVSAPWKSEPKALPLLNKAFEIYYDAYQATNNIDDPNMQGSVRRSLDKAAKYWYFLYSSPNKVNSLVGAFEHLDKNDGKWIDDNVGSYNGGVGGNGWVQPVPSAAASFLRAVDDNIKELKEHLGEIAEGISLAAEGQEEPDTNWKKVGEGLEKVEKFGKYAKPLLWVAPESLKEGAETLLEWDERAGKIHGYMSKLMTIGASNQPLEDFILMGVTQALNYLPVLGGFYGRIVSEIPGFAEHMEEFSDDYWAKRGMQTYRRSIGMGHMFSH
jgi:hypothetical protein